MDMFGDRGEHDILAKTGALIIRECTEETKQPK